MKRSLCVTITITVICLAVLTAITSAQTATTGAIEGRVVDMNGNAVSGLELTVSGANVVNELTATADGGGHFRISNLPPGRYQISAKGIGVIASPGVEVNLGRVSTVAITLQSQDATNATAGASVDVANNTTGTNVSTEQFSHFPTQRTLQSLFTIAPTASRSGLRNSSGVDRDPSVAGSSGPENNYTFDGINVSDPAFGGSGANLPLEFVQELQIQTGAFGAQFGKSTGGVFNVTTKSGTNTFHGDVFGYFTPGAFVRDVKASALPATGSAQNGYSQYDAGFDIGGPIAKDKLWFFGGFNPRRRTNDFLTQTFLTPVQNEITTAFYAGKLTWRINSQHTITFSTFGDHQNQEGFLFGGTGFGNPESFNGETRTGSSSYSFRLNSVLTPHWSAEFSGGFYLGRADTLPGGDVRELITDEFALVNNGAVLTPTDTNVQTGFSSLNLAFVNGTGLGASALQRNFVRQGFGLQSRQDRDRFEIAARLQSIWGTHTLSYGFGLEHDRYRILTNATGPSRNFAATTTPILNGFRVTNQFDVCRGNTATATIICPSITVQSRAQALVAAGRFGTQYTNTANGTVTLQDIVNPILILSAVSVRDFRLDTHGDFAHTNVESVYVQDDFRVTRNLNLNLGLRGDYQQIHTSKSKYFTLNDFISNTQPRLGFVWDFTGEGRGKVFANFARFLEAPIPLDLNVRAGGDGQQVDYNIRVNRLNAPEGSTTVTDFGNLGGIRTPADPGLKPQSVNEVTAGIEYEVAKDFALGVRGIYRAQDQIIEDGSPDDGAKYFLFNPGRREPGTTEEGSFTYAGVGFGRARRYYRAFEFTAEKRFSRNYQFLASYVFSSLIGNYEGLLRNDNGEQDPNITSQFDLISLLFNTYGRLPNDRPHQFKFDGSYCWSFKLTTAASFRASSGIPFDQLIPHPVYGNNQGFGLPRGTAVNPLTGSGRTPALYNLDLGIYYPIQLSENKHLNLEFDWFNVINSQKAVREDTTFSVRGDTSFFSTVTNPLYGRGTIFQSPSAWRLGVKFTF